MSVMSNPSIRSEVLRLRTYSRDKDGFLETKQDIADRIGRHTNHLVNDTLRDNEIQAVKDIFMSNKGSLAGRTLWLGGTDIAYNRPASQFNCSFLNLCTVYDYVDAFWLLLQGCGVGFRIQPGTIQGFYRPVNLTIIPSTNGPYDKGHPENVETYHDGVWTIRIGDSAEAWAKSFGKILQHEYPAHTLVLDFSNIRGPGGRLRGYGWICNGWEPFGQALEKLVHILNDKCGCLLDEIDGLDIMNIMGTVLSSRRSAEIALMDFHNQRIYQFAAAKKDCGTAKPHRFQSNNSIVFYTRPSRKELQDIFDLIVACGGSEPGFINGEAARRRAPWFVGVNPCAEILLANYGFCNLVEPNVSAHSSFADLLHTVHVLARANYRQTLVDLKDGVLQPAWDQTNKSLHLCGVGLTGIAASTLTDYEIIQLRNQAVLGTYGMADELGLPRPKAVTTIKPSGTLSKIMDTTEGIHTPLGKYMFNWVTFSKEDPLVSILKASGYTTKVHPFDSTSVLINFPVEYKNVPFTKVNGCEVNIESAVAQLERYKRYTTLYADHNVSNTISYSIEEIPEIIDWLLANWDSYIGVSWLFRNDPTKTAEDLGYAYLPQNVVTEQEWRQYVSKLSTPDLSKVPSGDWTTNDGGCASGACPIR